MRTGCILCRFGIDRAGSRRAAGVDRGGVRPGSHRGLTPVRPRSDPNCSDALAVHEPHLVATILRRLGVLDYRVSPSLTARVAYDRNRTVFDRVVDAETDAAVAPPPSRSRR